MGISNVLLLLPRLFPSLCLSISFFFFFILLFMTNFSFLLASTSNSTTPNFGNETNGNLVFSSSSSSAPPPIPLFKSKSSSFKPSIAVIVGVLTTIFSVTFLLLLYAKHCRREISNNPFFDNSYPHRISDRKNSGIDRGTIDSLPIFRFSSLMGRKDGLECAVCLNRFEPTEVLRLLPKCKHAFHVECVDTWLDAHSTCPLCRYRVDPEDILLVEKEDNNNRIPYQNDVVRESGSGSVSRVSGRHSFAGSKPDSTTSFVPRRSLDSWNFSRKKRNAENLTTVGCFDKPRKDGLLLDNKTSGTITGAAAAEQRRLEHRIIISGAATGFESDGPNHRWSDVQPSDLLFLKSEMILSDSRRFLGLYKGSRPSAASGGGGIDGRNEINGRSVSEITGLCRFRSNDEEQRQQLRAEQRQRQAGAVSRWLAWISQPQRQRQTPPPPISSSSLV